MKSVWPDGTFKTRVKDRKSGGPPQVGEYVLPENMPKVQFSELPDACPFCCERLCIPFPQPCSRIIGFTGEVDRGMHVAYAEPVPQDIRVVLCRVCHVCFAEPR